MVRGWLDIFAAEDRNLLVTKIGELSTGKRCGPMLVSICPPEVARGASPAPPKAVKVVFNACRIPDHDDVIYCTLTVANVGLAKAARAAEARTAGGLLRRDAFETAAVETLEAARAAGQGVEITFIEFVGAAGFRARPGHCRGHPFSDIWRASGTGKRGME